MAGRRSTARALVPYRDKRDFGKTPEPGPEAAAARPGRGAGRRAFVVHKHAARHLHYDFRLELAGTLKSWAVPKGPSLDPRVKRMAVQVEDHPLAYAGFEGRIPPGQYGAGSVVVWDRGTWQPVGDAAAGLRAGKLEFDLRGHKLIGRWVMLRLRDAARRPNDKAHWLLVKVRDAAARPESDYSVVEAEPGSVLQDGAAPAVAPAAGAPAAALPNALAPQLATRVASPPAGEGWTYELKFDGYRLLARVGAGGVRLFTRNGHDWSARLPALQRAVQALGLHDAWLDGELVALDAQGVPSFQRLQNAFEGGRAGTVGATLAYYLFDLPFDAGEDLRARPLSERRERLRRHLHGVADGGDGLLRFSEDFARNGQDLLASACALRMEGLIGKRLDAPYVAGRSTSWIKLKCGERQEFVIGGYTDPQGTRVGLGSLLLGVHDRDGRLRYAGRVGSGFDDAALRRLARALAARRAAQPPFAAVPAAARAGAHWVKPELVAEVSFAQWTAGGLVRQAVFQGLREDKPAQAIGREEARPPPRTPAPPAAALHVTHPERVVDAQSGVTKRELVDYYAAAAERLLPHLRGRPVALLRAPDGVGRATFFQKHAREAGGLPALKRLDPALDPGHDPLLEIGSVKAVLEAAQMNVIELHTWNAKSRRIDKPDRMVFDLDPGEGVPWPRVREAATLVRVLLQELALEPLLKTSGGKGLHLVVPLAARWDWDTVKGLSQAIVQHLAATLPKQFVAKSGPRNRVGRIFVDYLRNGRGATTVAAWSVRARPGLGVSVPVAWDELAELRSGAHWTVRDAPRRLAQADPWQAAATRGQSLRTALQRLAGAPA